MMMTKKRATLLRRLSWILPVLVLSTTAVPAARAQDYPARTVKIVVPFPAGGTADVMPRIIADWLSRKWGQSVIIEDRYRCRRQCRCRGRGKVRSRWLHAAGDAAGPAGRSIRTSIRISTSTHLNLSRSGSWAGCPTRSWSIRTRSRQIASKISSTYAQANDGKLTDATQGNGTTSHLTSELFQMVAHVKLAERALSRLGAGAQRSRRRQRRLHVR